MGAAACQSDRLRAVIVVFYLGGIGCFTKVNRPHSGGAKTKQEAETAKCTREFAIHEHRCQPKTEQDTADQGEYPGQEHIEAFKRART